MNDKMLDKFNKLDKKLEDKILPISHNFPDERPDILPNDFPTDTSWRGKKYPDKPPIGIGSDKRPGGWFPNSKRKNKGETMLERFWKTIKWIFWDDSINEIKFFWFIVFVISLIISITSLIGYIATDRRTSEEKLLDYEAAHILCIELTNLSENACDIFAFEESSLIRN